MQVMDGVPMHGEDSNDGQGGDGHSEGSGDTPVMVHGIAELEADSEVSYKTAGVPCCFAKLATEVMGTQRSSRAVHCQPPSSS